jgi:hypothetical protein
LLNLKKRKSCGIITVFCRGVNLLIPNVWFGTHKFFIFKQLFLIAICGVVNMFIVEIHLKKLFELWSLIRTSLHISFIVVVTCNNFIQSKKKNPYGINMLLSLTCRVVPPLFGIHDTMQRLSYYHETQIRLYTTLFVPNLDTKIIHNIHTWSHMCRLVKPQVEDIRGGVSQCSLAIYIKKLS